MTEIVEDVAKSRTQLTVRFKHHKLSAHVQPKKSAAHRPLPVPLYLHCLGGNWDGQIELATSGFLKLRIQGMPPIQVGQELQFQCFGTPSGAAIRTQTGIIQHAHIQQGTTAWKGRTILLVALDDSQETFGSDPTSQQNPFTLALGSFVISQFTKKESERSGEMVAYSDESLHPPRTTTNPQHVQSMRGTDQSPRISNCKFSIRNSSGRSIMAYHDFPSETDSSILPIVVIAPGYGETKRDYLTLAYYFSSNGFQVIRYDHTNHVGESQGNHFECSLSSMKHDFQTVTQFVRQQWPHRPVIGVASSLASRVALRAEAEEPSLALLILLVGVVNVRQSVATVHQEDVFAQYLNGQIQDSANILGFNVGHHFLHDAITNNFATLHSTLEDVHALETPVMYVSAENDAWIDHKDLQTFKFAAGEQVSKWLDVPGALHRLQENPRIARMTYRCIIEHCRECVTPSHRHDIREPNRVDLGRQNRQEKIPSSQHSPTEVGQAFWTDYLGHFQTVGKCQDYVQLLDHVFHALGPITPGQRLLDAGCGNGNAGLFFLESLQETQKQPDVISEYPIRYVGIDVVHEALSRAQCQMTQAYHSRQRSTTAGFPAVHMSWAQIDLQHSLPFADNQFDRIVSNLVLGYLPDAHEVLRELFRVLAPGGRMVISNLKPNGDFSGIYQKLVSHRGLKDQKFEARELLNNYGKIRQAEKEGRFRFYDQREWRNTLHALKGVYPAVYPTFSNQAYLIVVEKPAATTHVPRLPRQESITRSRSSNESIHTFQKVA